MRKLARGTNGNSKAALRRLYGERRRLMAQLAKTDARISKLQPPKRELDLPAFDRWLDELSEGLEHLPPVPRDLSRVGVYDSHD